LEVSKRTLQIFSSSSVIYESMSDPLLFEEVWVVWDHTARSSPVLRENPDQFVACPSPAGPKGRAFISVIAR
jgi:multiple sugar transport system substrate-binding protein